MKPNNRQNKRRVVAKHEKGSKKKTDFEEVHWEDPKKVDC